MRASTYVRPAALESRLVHLELRSEESEKKRKRKKNRRKFGQNCDIFHSLESRKVGILLFAFVPPCKSVLRAIKRVEGGKKTRKTNFFLPFFPLFREPSSPPPLPSKCNGPFPFVADSSTAGRAMQQERTSQIELNESTINHKRSGQEYILRRLWNVARFPCNSSANQTAVTSYKNVG